MNPEQIQKWREEKMILEDKPPPLPSPVRDARRKELCKLLEGAFCDHYHFKRSRAAETFYYDCLQPLWRSKQISDHWFDHPTFYRTMEGGQQAFVITSQPYGTSRRNLNATGYYELSKIQQAAGETGAILLNTEQWSWYYPGWANCFTLIFPRSVVTQLRKRVGAL